MDNNLKNYFADKYIEGYAIEQDLEKRYKKQQSQNGLNKCLINLIKHYEEYKERIYESSFVASKNILEEEITDFISVLGDNECLKNMHPVEGIDIYHLVLLDADTLLLIEQSKFYNFLIFRLIKVSDAKFYRYSEYNNFALGELTKLQYNEEIQFSLSFLGLDKYSNLIGKSLSDVIEPISLEEMLTRYKKKQETKTAQRIIKLQ